MSIYGERNVFQVNVNKMRTFGKKAEVRMGAKAATAWSFLHIQMGSFECCTKRVRLRSESSERSGSEPDRFRAAAPSPSG